MGEARFRVRDWAYQLVLGAILFGSAGRLDLPWLWACVGVYAAMAVAKRYAGSPALTQPTIGRGPVGKDRFTMWAVLPLTLAHLVIAGLDVGRFHWSGPIPVGARIGGLAGMAAFMGLVLWAKNVNPFAEPTIRIQRERNHRVIMDGPYGYVRHPGYVGSQGALLCSCLALGSWWAMLPAGVYLLVIFRRTVLEDRFLQEELAGYATYCQEARYRLVPGVW